MTKTKSETRSTRVVQAGTSAAELLGANSEIARKLKQYHDELLSQDVPDRFADLLTRLEQAELQARLETTETKAES